MDIPIFHIVISSQQFCAQFIHSHIISIDGHWCLLQRFPCLGNAYGPGTTQPVLLGLENPRTQFLQLFLSLHRRLLSGFACTMSTDYLVQALLFDVSLVSRCGLIRDAHADQVSLKRRDQVEFPEVGAGFQTQPFHQLRS